MIKTHTLLAPSLIMNNRNKICAINSVVPLVLSPKMLEYFVCQPVIGIKTV